ncbi:FAD-linked sulfhydryl oxidase ERV1-like [Populus nigra]|uniref:FAD-linked sulfhydryl oxidase ERV1-like n=1 Tax=Populus nigra TaxID=3691 RepID=UPI002B268F8B|nr:FAD-linked sulfhydryl oxidase ERV1-like [Populus nigra]
MTRDSHFKRTKHHPSSDSLHSRPLVSATTPPSRVCNNMSDNPLQHLFQKVSNCIQTHLANFTGQPQNPSSSTSKNTIFSLSPPSSHLSSKIYPANRDTSSVQAKDVLNKGKSAAPVTKEELGRATWTFLHTLAAQYPEHPTRQQKKDVKELMAILSRMYPCQECADHFKEVLRVNPVQAGSHVEFSQWLCHVHNVVNRSLGKLVFPCERVDARWGKLECEQRACDLQGTTNFDED